MDHPLAIMLENAQDFLRRVLAQVPLVLVAIIVFVLFYFAAKLSRRLIRSALRRYDPALARMMAGLAQGALVALGVLTALWIAIPTIKFTEIFTSLGLTGLILGFALRDILENFVAGLLILWRRPFRAGDQIRSGRHEGTVQEVNFRSTVLNTYDGLKVFIPNGRVFTEPLENMTAYAERRSLVVLGIDQAASVAHARAVILDTLRGIEGVLREPPPVVFFDAVGEYTNNLHVLYWTRPPTRFSELATKSEVTERLSLALQEAGITFPYPVRTVRLEPVSPAGPGSLPDGANGAVPSGGVHEAGERPPADQRGASE